MKRKPTTNPRLGDQPLSFVKLQSTFERNLLAVGNKYIVSGQFSDSRHIPYEVKNGVVYRVKKD